MGFKKGYVPWNRGKIPPTKGLSMEQIYGKERAEIIRQKQSIIKKGKISPRKGITNEQEYGKKRAEEIWKKRDIALREFLKSERYLDKIKNNPNFGMRGKRHSEETKQKLSIAGKKRHHTEEIRHKISIAHQGMKHSKESKKKMSLSQKSLWGEERKKEMSILMKGRKSNKKGLLIEQFYGKKRAEELKKKMSLAHKGINLGKHCSEETKMKISLANKGKKGKKHTETTKHLISISSLKHWQDEGYREKTIKSMVQGRLKRPTSFEQKISQLCFKHHLPFIYTGDGRLLIGYKNPDFVCEEKKIIIEVFLDYFKVRDYGNIENYMNVRREHFAKFGYKTLFISEKEIKCPNWEEVCLNKIKGELN